MIWQRLRLALMTSVVLAAAQGAVWADDAKDDDDTEEKMDKPEEKKADACPTTRKICVKEWVPEWYETTRTCYKREMVQEKYTAYRYENVQEKRKRTVYKWVNEAREVERCVCKMVPCVEERTVYEKHWVCKPCTYTVRKCVDRGHWECREVPCGPSLKDRLHSLCHKKGCCDNNCCPTDCCQPCRTKTVRVWCANKVYCEQTCTKMVRTCECVAKKCQVTVCKPVYEKVKCQVNCCVCKPCGEEEYCCCVRKCVPYECTRCVCKCVPVCEKVKCCRMVCKTVEKEVPVCECCAPSCCNDCCAPSCGHKLFGGFRKGHGGCCNSCGNSCGTGCCK